MAGIVIEDLQRPTEISQITVLDVIQELETTEIEQCRNMLWQDERMCALGIVYDLAHRRGLIDWSNKLSNPLDISLVPNNLGRMIHGQLIHLYLPRELQHKRPEQNPRYCTDRIVHSIHELNDEGFSFKELAVVLRFNLNLSLNRSLN